MVDIVTTLSNVPQVNVATKIIEQVYSYSTNKIVEFINILPWNVVRGKCLS